MTPTRPTPAAIPAPPPAQAPGQPTHLYALQLIAYCVANGPGLLSDEQLDQAIRFYPLAVHRIEPALAEGLARTRRQMTNSATMRAQQRADRDARIQAWIDQANQDANQDSDQAHQEDAVPQADQAPPDPRDQAIRLMRAALQLIQDPGTTDQDNGNGNGGGSRVPVAPRPPKFPPSNAQAVPPRTPPQRPQAPQIDF